MMHPYTTFDKSSCLMAVQIFEMTVGKAKLNENKAIKQVQLDTVQAINAHTSAVNTSRTVIGYTEKNGTKVYLIVNCDSDGYYMTYVEATRIGFLGGILKRRFDEPMTEQFIKSLQSDYRQLGLNL